MLEVRVYDEVPAVSRLCCLHLLIEDFLPFTCGHAFTHGLVSVGGEGGQAAPEREHRERWQAQGRAAQSPRSKNPHLPDQEEAGPAPSFVRRGTCFHGNQAGRQRIELGEKRISERVFQGPEATEAGFVCLVTQNRMGVLKGG